MPSVPLACGRYAPTEMQAGFVTADARLDQRLAQTETRLTKRMFAFWVAQAATTAGLVFGVVKLMGT